MFLTDGFISFLYYLDHGTSISENVRYKDVSFSLVCKLSVRENGYFQFKPRCFSFSLLAVTVLQRASVPFSTFSAGTLSAP